MKFIPRIYQKPLIDFVINNPKSGLLLDMGIGKTIITLMAITKLSDYYLEVAKVLIIAPKRVVEYTWPNEIDKWDDVKHIKYSVATGTERERIKALNIDALIYLINRENVDWLYNYYRENGIEFDFDMVVVDESSSFKNPSSVRFKALKKIIKNSDRVVILTGTPTPNGLMDLWSQVYLLDKGKRLGTSIGRYRNAYFHPGRRKGYVVYDWVLNEGAEDAIYESIKDIVVSMRAIDHLDMPERIDNFIRIPMPPDVETLYKKLSRDFILRLKDNIITAPTAGVLVQKLLQLANGAAYIEDGGYEVIHNLKLEALREIIEDNDSPILVFYNFKSDLVRLKTFFKNYHPKTLDDKGAFEAWNKGEIKLMFANPASMAHGLNIQSGGHLIVWFGLTFNLELYQQANARLYRQGQKSSNVIINHLLLANSIDEEAINRLDQKDSVQQSLIDYVKAEIRRVT